MIRFFRTLRQSLLAENRVSKYLLYAVGEIVLVILGILIALQVNNWREDLKSNRYERSILKEIRNSLLDGIPDSKAIGERARRTTEGALRMARHLNGVRLPEDSLYLLIDRLRFRRIYQYNSGPYESLKSAGIERISNDSLRFELIALYDDLLPAADELLNEVLRERISDNEERYRELFPPSGLDVTPGGSLEYRIEISDETLKSSLFRQFVFEASVNSQLMEGMMDDLVTRMERVNALIEDELNLP